MKQSVVLALVWFVVTATSPAGTPNTPAVKTVAEVRITSEADLARAVAELNQPETRMQAFAELLAFAEPLGGFMVDTGNEELNALHEKALESVRKCPDLESIVVSVIQRLSAPDAQISAIPALIRFAGPELYQVGSVIFGGTGDEKFDGLRKRAAAALHKCADIETVSRALDSDDPLIQFWAVWHYRGFEPADPNQNSWIALLPKLERLVARADGNIRELAINTLQSYPETSRFLAERIELERSPQVLMRLMYHTPLPEFQRQFMDRFLPLLDDPQKTVRHSALLFVGFNSNRAPMWQFTFDRRVFDRVLELTRSASADERSSAAYALTDIRHLDLDQSREAFLRLAKDTSADVRWRAGAGLSEQLDRTDVGLAIATLLRDEVPLVRYMTVLAVGPEKHVLELQQLTKCADPKTAEWAAQKLNQIGPKK